MPGLTGSADAGPWRFVSFLLENMAGYCGKLEKQEILKGKTKRGIRRETETGTPTGLIRFSIWHDLWLNCRVCI